MEPNQKVFLHGLRYSEPIREECESVEDAVRVARDWLPGDDYDSSMFGYGIPVDIKDENGQILMNESELEIALYGA